MERISRSEFQEILKKGRGLHAPHVSLSAVRAQGGKGSAFAFVVSRKVSGKAVVRNLLKRRAHSIVRSGLPRMRSALRGAFFFKKGAAGLSFDELKQEIDSLLLREVVFPRTAV